MKAHLFIPEEKASYSNKPHRRLKHKAKQTYMSIVDVVFLQMQRLTHERKKRAEKLAKNTQAGIFCVRRISPKNKLIHIQTQSMVDTNKPFSSPPRLFPPSFVFDT